MGSSDAEERAVAAERTVEVLKKKVFELYNGGSQSALHRQLEKSRRSGAACRDRVKTTAAGSGRERESPSRREPSVGWHWSVLQSGLAPSVWCRPHLASGTAGTGLVCSARRGSGVIADGLRSTSLRRQRAVATGVEVSMTACDHLPIHRFTRDPGTGAATSRWRGGGRGREGAKSCARGRGTRAG